MSKYNVVKEKSFAFALRCIKLYRYLRDDKNEYVISKQILRSGTSIGANVKEGIFAQSRPVFYSTHLRFSLLKRQIRCLPIAESY